jgi:hypothetical protein
MMTRHLISIWVSWLPMLIIVPAFSFIFWRSWLRARGHSDITFPNVLEQTIDALESKNTSLERIAAAQQKRTQGL